MTPEERAEQAAAAVNFAVCRRILTLYSIRLERYEAAGGRAIDIAGAIDGGRCSSPDPSRVSPLLDWLVRVAWAGYRLSPNRSEALRRMSILIARTTRRLKSAEASWGRIAAELDDTPEEVRRTFTVALPLFLCALDEYRVTAELHPDAVPDDAAPIRYASAELSQNAA